MSLEKLYTDATSGNAFLSRTKQAADVGPINGVNFMDGDPRSGTPAPDQVQTEFKRNTAGDFRYGGGGKVPGVYSLSRWLARGTTKGDTYLTNNKFTTISDVRNANVKVQKYGWLTSGETFIGKLGVDPKARVQGPSGGPSPASL